jgi:hypothetical protein
MKNNTNPKQECAGRAEAVLIEQQGEAFMDRTQILRAIHEAYGSGRPVERVMRECLSVARADGEDRRSQLIVPDLEYGRSIYRKRRCGKVASFFRCFLR